MPIDFSKEDLLSLTDAARSLPKVNGKRPHVTTVWRWARFGLNGVCLEYVRLGSRICTSTQALGRFANALAAVDMPKPTQPSHVALTTPETPAARSEAIERAKKILDDEGI